MTPPDETPATLDEAREAAIRARADAATPGPWHYSDVDGVAGGTFYDETVALGTVDYDTMPMSQFGYPAGWDDSIHRFRSTEEADANGEFIAHAREDVPYLLDAHAALTDALALAKEERDRAISIAKEGDNWHSLCIDPIDYARERARADAAERRDEGYALMLASANDDVARLQAWGDALQRAVERVRERCADEGVAGDLDAYRSVMHERAFILALLDAATPETEENDGD